MNANKYLEIFDALPSMVREGGRAQKPAPGGRIREDVVKSIWMGQPWSPHPIRDIKGGLVEIISPGWLNGGGGPDFKDALFKLDNGDIRKGDVEIDVHSSDWQRARRHRDPAYNDVILHVVFYCDLAYGPMTTAIGRALIEVELGPECRELADKIRSDGGIDPKQADLAKITGKCGDEFGGIGVSKALGLIEAAGEARLLLKSGRYHDAIRNGEAADVLYQGLFEAFGYRPFKTRFAKLARVAPLWKLKLVLKNVGRLKRPMVLQSALFGVAGLLPTNSFIADAPDAQTHNYSSLLREGWAEVERKSGLKREFGHEEWKNGSTSPANLPAGRLAGIAHFLALHIDSDLEVLFLRALDRFPMDGMVKDKREHIAKIAKLFPSPEDDYWARRYVLGGKTLARPRKLVGMENASLIVINVIIPYALARARSGNSAKEENVARRIFRAMPRQTNNSIVKFMSERLCGEMSGRELTNSAIRQQGLMMIYADFCITSAGGCAGCRFATYLRKLKV
ncbi:hypothetical protein MNBD_NITROSPINAE02-894 [hydrothermal vent metagenome]|uniref:DUF2851 domain-containing protein n=1 Tax=hydrothermal vent metagenome TaxID=652676 RepID=A0A3B1BLY3_9ZZZZ